MVVVSVHRLDENRRTKAAKPLASASARMGAKRDRALGIALKTA